jgi:anthranilate/para-aminobenzoate synthase component I
VIGVRLLSKTLGVPDAFEAFIALRAAYGERDVYLLESLAGPERDRARALVGICPLLTLEVSEGSIVVGGHPAVAATVRDLLAGSPLVERLDEAFVLRDPKRLWDVLRAIENVFDVDRIDDERFGFGFLAVFGYDAVHYIEDLPRTIPATGAVPDVMLCLHAASLDIDLLAGNGVLTVAVAADWDAAPDLDALVEVLTAPAPEAYDDRGPGPVARISDLRTTTTADCFQRKVDIALAHIRKGDIYQVQLGHEVWIPYDGDDLDVYRRMRATNPSPYMGFIPMPECTVLAASPELHVLVCGGTATMRPIAGTIRRGADPEADAKAAQELRSSEKERAEHVMLVDLCRNDLGRMAVTGTVQTTDMMTVETYPHVFHLVSTVTARVAPGRDGYDVIQATFPAGTMTGAPKIRAMQIIEELEDSRRGIYAGIFGVIGFGGFADLALCIRTVIREDGCLRTRASAGVVVDSTPVGEWTETLTKLRSSVWAITGEELR